MEQIGLFQLESLTISRSPFLFFDLRENTDNSRLPLELQRCLQSSKPCAADDVEKTLREQNVQRHHPIVLFCEQGQNSAQAARRLETAGFENVYIVTDGVSGLLEELDFSSSTK